MVELHGLNQWTLVASALQGRGSKQCCERYEAEPNQLFDLAVLHSNEFLAPKLIFTGTKITYVLILLKTYGQDTTTLPL